MGLLLKNTKPVLVFKTSKHGALNSWSYRHLSYLFRIDPERLFFVLTPTRAMVDYTWDFETYFGYDVGARENQDMGVPITWCTVLMMNDEYVYIPTDIFEQEISQGNLVKVSI